MNHRWLSSRLTGFGLAKRLVRRQSGLQAALHLEELEARLLVARGGAAVRWGSLPLPANLFHNGVVSNPDVLASLLEGLFNTMGAPRTRVLVSLGNVRGIMRTLQFPPVRPNLMREALRRELSREVLIPLDDHHIVWEKMQIEDGIQQTRVLAVPREEVISVLAVLRKARIYSAMVEWKPQVVARAVDAAEALIVVMEQRGFDVILVQQGVPVVVRRIDFPSSEMSRDEQVESVAGELSLTLSYAASEQQGQATPSILSYAASEQQGDATPSDRQVYLFGKYGSDPWVRERLQAATGLTLEEFATPPPEFPAWEYAANLGLLRRFAGKSASLSKGMSGFPGLTPPHWGPRIGTARQAVVAAGLSIVALGFAGFALPDVVRPDHGIADLEQSVGRVERQVTMAQVEIGQLNMLQGQVSDAEGKLRAMQDGLGRLEARDLIWPTLGPRLTAPGERVVLTTVAEDDTTLTISGSAPSYSDVLSFATVLGRSAEFKDVVVKSLVSDTSPARGGQVRFNLVAKKITGDSVTGGSDASPTKR